jgi:adenosylmethionine---8-amino-7-oxononanoate aminotransferase
MNSTYQRLADLDRRHLWHPFTQMKVWMAEPDLPIIVRGEGNYLIDTDGRRYLDGVSSLWCNVHGHRKPELDAALRSQIDLIAHSTLLGLSHPAAIELAHQLITFAPAGLTRVFYSDSGAEAVEVALRMAIQYWRLVGQPSRTEFLTLTESYHGDTVGSVSLGYSETFHRHVQPLVFPVLKTDPPHVFRFYRGMEAEAAEAAAIAAARDLIRRKPDQLAALIIEPIVQGAAGIWTHSARYLGELAALAREAGALVICDEVATGFGRTGRLFASEHANLRPDLMCLGKGITGGYLPLAATLATERIFAAFLGEPDEYRAFYYGHTYTGNPLAASVALANLAIFSDERVIDRSQPLIAQLMEGLRSRFEGHPQVADLRQCGLMAAIELMENPAERQAFRVERQTGANVIRRARKAGVIIRPLGDVIVLMPPLSITRGELETLLDVTRDSIDQVVRQV